MNKLKNDGLIATGVNDTYITFNGTAVRDMAGNPVNTLSGLVHKVRNFFANILPPKISRFTLQFSDSTLQLVLTFSETINITSFDPTAITLKSSGDGNATWSYSLAYTPPSSATQEVLGTVVVNISNADRLNIAALREPGAPGEQGQGLLQSANMTFLSADRTPESAHLGFVCCRPSECIVYH